MSGDAFRRSSDTLWRGLPLCHPNLWFHEEKSNSLQGGTALIYPPPLPQGDFQQPQGSLVVNYRLWRSLELHKHHSALGLAVALRPVQPVTLIRPHAARRAARFFVEKFPGRPLYAVKANPSPDLLRILWESGITHYDVASIAEIRLVAETLQIGRASCRERV